MAGTTWPFVGRDGELQRVLEALHPERGGIVVSGAAGVGKTRLATEALGRLGTTDRPRVRCAGSLSAASVPLGALAPLLPGASETALDGDLLAGARDAVVRGYRDGLLLVIDDAHLLDDISAAFAHQLALGRDASLLVTVRSGERVPDAIRALWKDELLEHLELQPFTMDSLQLVLESALGGRLDDSTAPQLHKLCGGNALFLRELVLEALECDELNDRTGTWHWSGRVHSRPRLARLIEQHMGQLDVDKRQLVDIVALVEQIPLDAALVLVNPDTIESAERRGLVVVTDEKMVEVSHPLYGEVARATMPAAARRRLVPEISCACLDVVPPTSVLVLRLALLYLDAEEPAPLQLLLDAAAQANARGNPHLGERLARAALVEEPTSFEGGRHLGEAIAAQGDLAGAEAIFAPLEGKEPNEQAIVRLAHQRIRVRSFGVTGDRAGTHRIALDAAERVKSDAQRAFLMSSVAEMALNSGDFRAAASVAEPVFGDPHAGIEAKFLAGMVAVTARAIVGEANEAALLAQDLIPLERRSVDIDPRATVRLVLARWLALIYAGRLNEALTMCSELLDNDRYRADEGFASEVLLLRGRALLMCGRPRAAASALREAIESLRRYDPRGRRRWAVALLAWAVALVGDQSEADELLAEAQAMDPSQTGMFEGDTQLAGAWVVAARGELSAARGIAMSFAEAAASMGMFSWAGIAFYDAMRLGERCASSRLIEIETRYNGALSCAVADHARALLSSDGEQLAHAAERLAAIGLNAAAAEALAQAATAYRAEGRRGAATGASARGELLHRGCEGIRTPILRQQPFVDAGLTSREREVAEIAALGASNREIADRLYTSVRTVEGHLLRAFAKLGIRNRGELAAALGLVTPQATND